MKKQLLTAFIAIMTSLSMLSSSIIASAESINEDTNRKKVLKEGYYTYNSVTNIEEYVEESFISSLENRNNLDDNVSENSFLCDHELVANDLSQYVYGTPDDEITYSNSEENEGTIANDFSISTNNTDVIAGGTDNRWQITTPSSYGQYRNTCRLRIKHSDNSYYIGTGFVLSDTAIATAGHCVYEFDTDSTNGNWVTSVEVWPAYSNGTKPYGAVTGTSFECGSAWKNNKDATQDWGIIQVSNSFPSLCGYLGLRWQSSSYVNTNVTVAGYPGYIGDNLETSVNGNYMYAHSNSVTWNSSSVVSYSQLDTSGGQSGSPVVFYSSDTGYTAIAIHRGTYNGNNSGVRLSEWLYNHFMSYR